MTWPTWLSHEPAWWIAVASAAVGLLVAFYPSALTGDEKAGIIALVTILANGLGTRALTTSTSKLASLGVTITPSIPVATVVPPPTVVPPQPPPIEVTVIKQPPPVGP
jgi:hypothetical protein